MDYINIQFLMLPAKMDGFTIKNPDGGYTIFINVGLSDAGQKAAYRHEMSHIDNQDYDHIHDVNFLEKIRHLLG